MQMPEALVFVSGFVGFIFKFLSLFMFFSPVNFPPATRLFPIFLFMFYVLSSVLI